MATRDTEPTTVTLRPVRARCDCGEMPGICTSCGEPRCAQCDPYTSESCLPPRQL